MWKVVVDFEFYIRLIFIWEFVLDFCILDEFLNCINMLFLVDICSFNYFEFVGFMGDDGFDFEMGEILFKVVECLCE